MRTHALVAFILIIIGVVAFTYQGFSFTTREKVIDFGPLQMTAEKTHSIPLPPLLGGVTLLAGIALLAMGGKKS